MAPFASVIGSLALALLPATAEAGRATLLASADLEDQAEVPNLKQFLSHGDTICGEPKIWHLMTDDPSVEGVQNIKWGEIEALAVAYMRSQEAIIKELEMTLEGLDGRIGDALKDEDPGVISTQQIAALIDTAVASFGGLKAAQDTQCGRPGFKPRPPRYAFQQSLDAFKAAATELFDGTVVSDSGLFLDDCKKLLPEEDEGSYCGNLCQRYADEAQALSDATTGANIGASAELLTQQYDAQEALARAQAELQQCKQAHESIQGFEVEIDALKKEMNDRHGDCIRAEEALDDATRDLKDLEGLLAEEEEKLPAAIAMLEEVGVDVSAARTALEALQKEEGAVKVTVESADRRLAEVQQRLFAAKQADKVIEELRAAVSVTAMKMQLFFERAVLKPTRDVGLDESLDLDRHFFENPKLIKSAGVMKETVYALDRFCKVEAKPVFEAVKHKVDLSPLCAIGNPCDIKVELNKAVLDTMQAEIEQIDSVRSWFDPYKGLPGMTSDRVEQLVADGELRGLREYSQVYSTTKFSEYLRGWMLGGRHLALVAQLKDMIVVLEGTFKELITEMSHFTEKMEVSTRLRADAESKLQEVASRQGLAADKKAALEKQIRELDERSGSMAKLLDDLEMEVMLAWAEYDKAREKLLAAHQEATSFLETSADEEMSAKLERQSADMQNEMLMLRGRLRIAKQAYEAVSSRITAIGASE